MVCCEGGFPRLILCVKKRKERASRTDETDEIPNHRWTPAPVKPVQEEPVRTAESILESTAVPGALIMFLPQPESPRRYLSHTHAHMHTHTLHISPSPSRETLTGRLCLGVCIMGVITVSYTNVGIRKGQYRSFPVGPSS